jgi:hypothetical protein
VNLVNHDSEKLIWLKKVPRKDRQHFFISQPFHDSSYVLFALSLSSSLLVLFFRNSLIITCSLLVEALIVDSLFVCEAQPAERLRSIVNTIRTNQMMNLFLLSSPSHYQQGSK